jgi:hypothetical protein
VSVDEIFDLHQALSSASFCFTQLNVGHFQILFLKRTLVIVIAIIRNWGMINGFSSHREEFEKDWAGGPRNSSLLKYGISTVFCSVL